jgi:3-keto-5-aminohexanoate cleavage enzyme
MSDRVVITCSVDGPIATPSENPNLPYTPEQFAEQAKAVYAEGASVIHIHSRGADGLPTSDYGRTKEILDAVHESCPILTQLSTGGFFPYEERARLVELKPRMASLNLCTMTFGKREFRNPPLEVRKVAARMMELGVKGELEIYDTGHLDFALRLLKEGLLLEPLQFSVVLGVDGGAAATPENLMRLVSHMPPNAIWQMIGVGAKVNLQLTTIALAMGGNARTGIEDTLWLSKGVMADNPSLIRRLVGVAKAIGRTPATVEETEQMLQLPKMEPALA